MEYDYIISCSIVTYIMNKEVEKMIVQGNKRENIKIGIKVKIVQKQDQRTGKLTEGVVGKILTNSPTHPHGIKVMLDNGIVGRVQEIL